MAGNHSFSMDKTDNVRFLMTTVGSFIQDRLIDKEQRTQQKEQCAERLAAEDGTTDKDTEIRYSDQAVLANLDWGIDALEEAVNTSNMETKLTRLDYAEKMLQVCAMLNSSHKTAGVPNFYLSAWAHLNLSCLWILRNNVHNAVLHILEMFTVDPFFSRIDFAPELWKTLFLPHMSSIVGWYSEERYRLMMDGIPDSTDLSFTVDFDQYLDESLILSLRPDQTEKLQQLEQVYGQSLDENTRLYAKYYRDCMTFDSTTSKKAIPMMPIAEPPMTPLHEVSRSIPDYVKFGPILPKSSGFSPILRQRENAREPSRLSVTSTSSQDIKGTATWVPQEGIPEENEVDSGEESPDLNYLKCESFQYEEQEREPGSFWYEEQERKSLQYEEPECGSFQYEEQERGHKSLRYVERERESLRYEEQKGERVSLNGFVTKKEEEIRPNIDPIEVKSWRNSHRIFSPDNCTIAGSPKTSSPKPDSHSKKESPSMSRLSSFRVREPTISLSFPASPRLHNDFSISSGDSDGEMTKSIRRNGGRARSVSYGNGTSQMTENSYLDESDEGSQSCVSLPLSEKLTSHSRPPKDFVCPITGQIFCDPVTLETGQTYERKAIQEWVKRGNTTCPITRQPLSATSMPKTNYVLKRLITSWKEQHPDLSQEFSCTETPRSSLCPPSSKENLSEYTPKKFSPYSRRTRNESIDDKTRRFAQAPVATSPTSVISQAALETTINGLNPHVTCLCTSEDLEECEAAVLKIGRIWKDSKSEPGLHSYFSKALIVNGFVEILSASMNREVLKTLVCILSELIFADDRVGETLTRIDCDFDCLASLLKNGLAEASVLIYLLRPTFSQFSSLDLIPSLVQFILTRNEDLDYNKLIMEPEDAAVAILEQILMGGDENSRSVDAMAVISANGIPALVKRLDRLEGRQAIVSILLCCIHADGGCKNLIASRIEFFPVLELFHGGNDSVRGICIEFLSELVQLNRRTFCNQILKRIKDEGAFSTMHTFLVYLQLAPMEQQPAVATLLLQLDLLVEPRKMSIYREEAIESLLEALCSKDFPNSQITALDALLSLSGRLTPSGKPYTEAWLLKIVGFDQQYNALMRSERPETDEIEWTVTMEEEEKATSSWEKRIAFVLCNHEKGAIFSALEECLVNNSMEMARSCLVMSTWLIHMLYCLPDTGVRDVARKALLGQFINVLQLSKNIEEKMLATLALKSFIADPGAVKAFGVYAKCLYKMLRKLKRNSTMVNDILKTLMNLPSVDATELWCCAEVAELDSRTSGEVLCLLHLKGRLISSHSDGTIKVWDTGKSVPRLIQEVREHIKAVTCLHVSSSGDKLYSGSMDKTIRVWAIKHEAIYCVQVHDVKDAVHELTANSKFACFSTQGTGVKIYNWSGVPKHVNFNKNVKSLAMTGTKLYCGCTGYSIQEVDLSRYTSTVFYAGAKKILGKQNIRSLCLHNGLLFAGGSSVDGIAGKVFSLSTKATIGSFSTGLDIHCMAVNNDYVFTASKCGVIEVWMKERVTRVAFIKMSGGGHAKITSLATNSHGEMLFAGCSEGKIQAWGLD